MSLQATPLDKIAEADLARLIEDGTSESLNTEYKREWSLSTNDGKKELLLDIASFANTDGGDIIYGIEADAGIPKRLVSLSSFDADAEQIRVTQLLANWTEPRVSGVDFRAVSVASGGCAFVIRIPRSWSGPHMVTYNGVNRFVGRSSASKFSLNVDQIRAAFFATDKTKDRISDFRIERVNKIARGSVGVTMASEYRQVLHIMPFVELTGYSPHLIVPLERQGLVPMGRISGMSPIINFEGYMVVAHNAQNLAYSYVQIFRNGFMEAVICRSGGSAGTTISPAYEGDIRQGIFNYCGVLQKLGRRPPYVIGLSHVNVDGFTMYQSPEFDAFDDPSPIKGPHLIVPAAILEATDENSINTATKQIFDQVWNACGLFGSVNFDTSGKWTPKNK